jgi:hypothetical protein
VGVNVDRPDAAAADHDALPRRAGLRAQTLGGQAATREYDSGRGFFQELPAIRHGTLPVECAVYQWRRVGAMVPSGVGSEWTCFTAAMSYNE